MRAEPERAKGKEQRGKSRAEGKALRAGREGLAGAESSNSSLSPLPPALCPQRSAAFPCNLQIRKTLCQRSENVTKTERQALDHVSLALFDRLLPAQRFDARLEAVNRFLGVLRAITQCVDIDWVPCRS